VNTLFGPSGGETIDTLNHNLTIDTSHSQQGAWPSVRNLSLVQFRSQNSANGRFMLVYREGSNTHSPNASLPCYTKYRSSRHCARLLSLFEVLSRGYTMVRRLHLRCTGAIFHLAPLVRRSNTFSKGQTVGNRESQTVRLEYPAFSAAEQHLVDDCNVE